MSEEHVLLRYDPGAAIWQRVTGSEVLSPGQRLLALPTYRAAIALRPGSGSNCSAERWSGSSLPIRKGPRAWLSPTAGW